MKSPGPEIGHYTTQVVSLRVRRRKCGGAAIGVFEGSTTQVVSLSALADCRHPTLFHVEHSIRCAEGTKVGLQRSQDELTRKLANALDEDA